ncbi:MAG: hypothetical protein JWO52_8232 [Gammaproteobacteria bacterium]|nr:hypothetical protein [Gammaproteobacteria bacterium]
MLALQLEADTVKVGKGGVPISIGATAVDHQRFGTSPTKHGTRYAKCRDTEWVQHQQSIVSRLLDLKPHG